MKVLSLFDGMSCGMLAMLGAGLSVDRYVAYEIDKYAVQTSTHNFPITEHKGDVFQADFTEYQGFDFLVGGSPCTYWSIAQKNNRETEASGMGWELFSQYVRALHEAKPKYFIYENNKSMSKAIRESITETFGFEPVCINSALVSAQNRQRLYWVGKLENGVYRKVRVDQPTDRGILLRDVLDCGCDLTSKDKSWAFTASYDGAVAWNTLERNQRNMVVEPVGTTKDEKSFALTAYYSTGQNAPHTLTKHKGSMAAEPVGIGYRGRMEDGKWVKRYESNGEPKANALTTAQTDSMVSEPIRVGSMPMQNGELSNSQGFRVYSIDGKSVTVIGCSAIGTKNGLYAIPCDVTTPVRVGCYPSPDGTIKNSQGMRLYSTDGKSVNLTSLGGGLGAKTGLYAIQCCPMQVREATAKGFTEINPDECVDLTQPNSKTRRGRNMANKSNCLMTSCQYYQYCGVLGYATACEWDENGRATKAISAADGKTYTVYEVKDGQITIKGKQYPIKLVDGLYIIRKLTVTECMRLQTVPEWYEFPVSDSQAYKMLGNGWTVEVIVHLINSIMVDVPEDSEQIRLF